MGLVVVLCVLALVQAFAQPIIGEIKALNEKDKQIAMGSKFMGDARPGEIYQKPNLAAQNTLYNNQPPVYFSPKDPGIDVVDFKSETTRFMKSFGVTTMKLVHQKLEPEDVRLLAWAEENEVLSPCATIGYFTHPVFQNRTLRGLVANCTIDAHKDVVVIPTKIIITTHRLMNSPDFDHIYENLQFDRSLNFDLDHIMLTLFVLLESQNPSSFWAPYLASLPRVIGVPAESDSYGYLFFDASKIVANIHRRQEAVEWQFTHLNTFFASHPQLLPKGLHFNRELFEWAYNLVTSRAFRLDFGVHKDTLCLVPFADLMNHAFTDVGWLFKGKHSIGLMSANEIEVGEQIFNDYGRLGNDALIQDFGFVLSDNPFTCAHVTLPSPTEVDSFLERRKGLLKMRNLELETPICTLMGAPTRDLLFAAVVRTLQGDRLSPSLSPMNLLEVINEKELVTALEYLKKAIDNRLAEYKYQRSQDERLLPLLAASANSQLMDQLSFSRYLAVFLRLEEKIILESTAEFIQLNLQNDCAALPPSYTGANDHTFNVRALKTCSKYLKRTMIPLLLDIAWENGLQRKRPRQHKGPWEDWDFSQDATVFPKEGQPKPLCQQGGDCPSADPDQDNTASKKKTA